MPSPQTYSPPLALTIISGVFLGLGALCFLIIVGDIVWRRGWRSMMGIMIPVYPINATYMMPVTLYTYFKYGRATKPASASEVESRHDSTSGKKQDSSDGLETKDESHHEHRHEPSSPSPQDLGNEKPGNTSNENPQSLEEGPTNHEHHGNHRHHHHHHSSPRPKWATVLIAVSHCGAGCVLGDLVGEWLVYGTNTTLAGAHIWAELLIDYAFALLFGIAFQYFSIAPMSGEYGPKTVWRAAKADVLSLTAFEVGAFGWMVAFQVGIFGYGLGIATWVYWWMMQVGMAFGFATAFPVNWFLISKGIKEPCA